MNKTCIVCRCEEVSLKDIEKAQANGMKTSQEIKMATRAGMGICQGRICRPLLEEIAGENAERSQEIPSKLTIHNPVRPVALGMVRKGK